MTSWTPCIVRLAGLDASIIEAFASTLDEKADRVRALEKVLTTARATAVDVLFQHVPTVDPVDRRTLLKWKRACFNGRPIGEIWRGNPGQRFGATVVDVLRDVASKEAAVETARSAFQTAYEAQLTRERQQLVHVAQNPNMRRGMTLASAATVANLHRAAGFHTGALDRKDRKLEQSLLRFASRAALKTSPFSTFTRVGLARLTDTNPVAPTIRWLPGTHLERSLLRLKRYLFHQLAEVLFTVPRFRDSLRLVLNNSLESIGPERARFFRRGFRGPDPETGGTRLNQPSILRLDLDRALVKEFRIQCGNRTFHFDDAQAVLGPFVESPEDAEGIADHLLALGCLEPVLPWCNTDVRAETKFLEYLRSLPFDETLGALIVGCEELIALEDSFAHTDDPVYHVEEIPRLIRDAWKRVVSLAGLRTDAKFVFSAKGDLYEDVVVENLAEERGEVLELPGSLLKGVMDDLDPLLVLGAFFMRRVDCLISLRAFAKEEWPGRSQVGLMDLFSKGQPLYRQFLASETEAVGAKAWYSTFNPLELDTLRQVASLRKEIGRGLDTCLIPSATGAEIDRDRLYRLAERVPVAYRPLISGCLFLQPAKADGSLWVLNRMYEGTGRYSSRYTAVMGEQQRLAFAHHLRGGCRVESGGRSAELVDLLCAQGDTLNVHALQTERVLEFPGEDSGAPRHRRLALQDLAVEIPEDGAVPLRMVDSSGQWILPAHLGGTVLRFMPIMVKFLALFGPGDLRRATPLPPDRDEAGVLIRDRVTLGHVVLLRKQWRVRLGSLIQSLQQMSETRAFELVHQWRRGQGVPARVFVLEKRPSPLEIDLYKPQFIDFRSPSFVKTFLAVAKVTPEPLVLEEVLPSTEDFPPTTRGARRALEIQLESVSVRNASSSDPPSGGSVTPANVAGVFANRG